MKNDSFINYFASTKYQFLGGWMEVSRLFANGSPSRGPGAAFPSPSCLTAAWDIARLVPTVFTALSQYGHRLPIISLFSLKDSSKCFCLIAMEKKPFKSIPILPAKWLVWMLKLKKLFFQLIKRKLTF